MAPSPPRAQDERVSIPLDPETALRALLLVDPDEPVEDDEAEAKEAPA